MHDVRVSLKLLLLIYQEDVEIFRHAMHVRTGNSPRDWLPGNRKKGI